MGTIVRFRLLPGIGYKRLPGISQVLALLCLAPLCVATESSGVAQANEGASQIAQNQQVAVPPSTVTGSTATIYVYREGKGGLVAVPFHPLIFADGKFVALLTANSYVERTVPVGPVLVSASPVFERFVRNSPYAALGRYAPLDLQWPVCNGEIKKPVCSWQQATATPQQETRGCSKIDWKRIDLANKDDVAICAKELESTTAALDDWLDPNRKMKAMMLGMMVPGTTGAVLMAQAASIPGGDFSQWLQMCGPDFVEKTSAQDAKGRSAKRGVKSETWERCDNEVVARYWMLSARKILIHAEAGKSYYFHWAVKGYGDLELVDEATGVRGMSKLHPVEDR